MTFVSGAAGRTRADGWKETPPAQAHQMDYQPTIALIMKKQIDGPTRQPKPV